MGRKSRLRQAKKKENQWSRVDLPSPPQFNGMNFDIWTSRMRVYLRYVDTHVELNDEAKDALALHLIQLAVDDKLMQMITAAKTSKEAWCILEEECSERGSSHKEPAVVVVQVEAEKNFEASVSQTEHKKFEMSESHIAVKHVDVVEVEEEATIVAAESVEATQEGTCQSSEVECDEEKLMKSKPKRVEVCEFASINSNQRAIDSHEERKAQEKYDEEILSEEELLILKDEISLIDELLNGKTAEKEISAENNNVHVENKIEKDSSIAANKDEEDSSMKAAKMSEEGSHVAAKDEGKGGSFATAVESAENEEMDEQDEGCEDEKLVEEIFEKWSPEEIRYYYELMWQQATDSQVAENMKSEDSMWEHHMMKATLNFIEGEETWQNAIGKFDDIDGRMSPKELEEIRKKKVRKKKKTRRIVEYKVWSKRKKKAGEGKTNFDLFCDCM